MRRSHPSYNALVQFLIRHKVKTPGPTASFLLSLSPHHIRHGIRIKKEDILAYGCETENYTFRAWQQDMVRLKLLEWGGYHLDTEHKIGIKLKKYINRTQIDTEALNQEIIPIEQRLDKLDRAIQRLIAKFDPPFTEEKYQQYTQETPNVNT